MSTNHGENILNSNYSSNIRNSNLHEHLGASVSVRALWEIAHEQGIALPKAIKNYWDFMKHIKVTENEPHDVYLNRFKATHMIQSSPIAVEMSMYHAVSHAYTKGNITTLEIRMNPLLRTDNKKYDADKIIFHACIGMKKAMMIYPIKVGLILGIERSFSSKEAIIIAEKAVKYKSLGVVGIDVSGKSPEYFRVDTFIEAYEIAKNNGLGTTFHTGEVTGSDEMLEIMQKINPDRIGHGVRCVDNPKLMDLLREKGTILEICPTSNMRLGVIKDAQELKTIINTLNDNDVKYCINTDGTVFLNTSIINEYNILKDNLILTEKEICELIDKSHSYTFIK